jgi:hypothetical protein
MPPLASSVPDYEAAAMITQWINSLPAKTKPLKVHIRQPRGARVKSQTITVSGTAAGDNLARIVYSVNGANEEAATGAAEWSAAVTLDEGRNEIIAYAEDTSGNRSRPARRLLNFKPATAGTD